MQDIILPIIFLFLLSLFKLKKELQLSNPFFNLIR